MDLLTIKNLLKFISTIGLALSIFFLIPIFAGFVYGEEIQKFVIFNASFFMLNLVIFVLLLKHKLEMRTRGAILSVNVIWILLGIAGAIPLYLYTHITFIDAFFEAISAFTTTGSTIYNDLETLPKMILMLRSVMHWLGGMGIIVLGVGLFSIINPTGSLTMFKAESTGVQMEKITPKIKDTALKLWIIYLAFTFLDMIFLKIGGMSVFDAVNHAFSTISTGGFSTKNASMGYWGDNYFILWTTTIFMILSGVNFIAHLKLFSLDSSGYKAEEVKYYFIVFLVLASFLTLFKFISGGGVAFSFTHSFFTIASVMTTTGFASLDYEQWGAIAIVIVFVTMFLGGNAGSTSGGMKTIRYVVLFKNLFAQITQTINPNKVVGVYIDKNSLNEKIIGSIMGFFFLFVLTNVAVAMYLYASGYDSMTSVSTAIACVGNVGPGFSLTGPAQNYSFFTSIDKIVLSFAMIVGRLEFYTVMMLFARSFWKRY